MILPSSIEIFKDGCSDTNLDQLRREKKGYLDIQIKNYLASYIENVFYLEPPTFAVIIFFVNLISIELRPLVDDPVLEEDRCAKDYHPESIFVLQGFNNARRLPSL